MTETRPRGADNDVSASRSAFTLSRRSRKCAPTSGPTAMATAEASDREPFGPTGPTVAAQSGRSTLILCQD